jgi:hypothetical protein
MKKPKPEYIAIDLSKILRTNKPKKKPTRKSKEQKTVQPCGNQRDLF